MTTPTLLATRRCYNAFHPVHAAYYFAPEHDEQYAGLGLEPGPMAYLAGRSAPLGAVSAGAVTALFYSFRPSLVGAKLPVAWQRTSPAAVLEARLRIADACLRRLLGPEALASREMAEAATLALAAAEACGRPGRPLAAANADLPVPGPAHLKLWHAATVLREHRGDGHLIALGQAGLDGIEALVSHTATGTAWKPHFLRATRGWTVQDWAAAQGRLRERGLLDEDGELTAVGMELRRELEAETDRLGLAPYAHLGADATKRLTDLAGGFTRTVLAGGGLPLHDMGKG
ncbi:SCO6745 family protein [Kitasatospora sp. McL0602]|uniref:SCO6745 family protein n=1 Tax=Kitasatospora sp. McL0602 TaxID=3439530 RepID=UPI003F8879B7